MSSFGKELCQSNGTGWSKAGIGEEKTLEGCVDGESGSNRGDLQEIAVSTRSPRSNSQSPHPLQTRATTRISAHVESFKGGVVFL